MQNKSDRRGLFNYDFVVICYYEIALTCPDFVRAKYEKVSNRTKKGERITKSEAQDLISQHGLSLVVDMQEGKIWDKKTSRNKKRV